MEESREVAHRSRGGSVMRSDDIPMNQQLAMIREALLNPDLKPDNAVVMADLMIKLEDRQRQADFNRDKIAAKEAMPAMYKRGINDHAGTRYVLFEDMQRAIDPVLSRFSLMLDFEVGHVGNDIAVTPVLRHRNGWVERGGTLKGPPDVIHKGRTPIQSVGSSVHYLKRYATEAILNLVRDGEDDDGVGAPNRLLNDRQENLLALAQKAYDEGTYAAWYAGQSSKDKSWLVTTGRHAGFGGAPALPGQDEADAPAARTDRRQQPAQGQRQAEKEPQSEKRQEAKTGKRTPEQMVSDYQAELEACTDEDAIDELTRMPNIMTWIGKMRAYPELHAQIIKSEKTARRRIDDAEGRREID